MNWFRQAIIYQVQRINRNFNTACLEVAYQQNYLFLANRTDWLHDPPSASLIGGTANFSLLYALLQVLRTQKIESILELGTGKSTSMFYQYVHEVGGSMTSIEDDTKWFEQLPDASDRFTPVLAPLKPTNVVGKHVEWYDTEIPAQDFDLILVDGPAAWQSTSQFNRFGILQWVPQALRSEFVIVVDDTSRRGEGELVELVDECLRGRGIRFGRRQIVANSSQTLICSKGFDELLFI